MQNNKNKNFKTPTPLYHHGERIFLTILNKLHLHIIFDHKSGNGINNSVGFFSLPHLIYKR